jgi:hypothetical protein
MTMKKIFKFSLLALFLGVMSCEDATDIVQKSELSEDLAYRTVGDLQTGLLGVYAAYSPDAGNNGAGYDAILFNDLFTDNIKRGISNSGQGNQEYGFILQTLSDFPNTIWANRYGTINFANRTLRAWERIAPGLEGAELAQANQIKAQLLALRALSHFDLLQYFSEDYQNPSAPGVIIMDFVPDITQTFPRSTTGEVFEFVMGDLDMAEDMIGSFSPPSSEAVNFFINADVIKAIKTRVALYKGDYTMANTLASELLADYPLTGFGSAPDPTDPATGAQAYIDMFLSDSPASELIWSLSRRQGDNGIAGLYYANEPGIAGSPFFEASNQLFNLYTDSDIRKEVNFILNESEIVGVNSPDNIILIGKYRGTVDGNQINDIKIFRGSEFAFIKAETDARAGNFGAAQATIQLLKNRRGDDSSTPAYTSLPIALKDILLQRRKEFAFEGHRYLDLKRLGAEVGENISRNDVDCGSFSAPCDLSSSDYRFTLPIPRSELDANPTIQQNPGY